MHNYNHHHKGSSGAIALEKWFALIQWLSPTVEKFARSHKFTLGDRIVNKSLDILDVLVEATFNKDPVTQLKKINTMLTQLRFLLRLAYGLKQLDQRRFEWCAREVDEVGRMVGAWLKICKMGADLV